MAGPLKGKKIIEFAGIGPGPFAAMLLADMGADVLRIERSGTNGVGLPIDPSKDLLNRNKRAIALDLKSPDGQSTARRLVESADGLIEGFRPGVMEKLGLGPDICTALNPRLVYGRMTGWGQSGPRADRAGHDINYLGLSGALHSMGKPGEPPLPPLNLVADFGGGAMLLVTGMLAAMLRAAETGEGDVIDAAMTDGSALLMTLFHGLAAMGLWQEGRGRNFLDGSAPFYRCYTTSDGAFMAVGAIEPQFYAQFIDGLGLPDYAGAQYDLARWREMHSSFAARFAEQSQAHWCSVFDDSDACVTPVHSLKGAIDEPHNQARGTFTEAFGIVQPTPAPRFEKAGVREISAPETPGDDEATISRWLTGD